LAENKDASTPGDPIAANFADQNVEVPHFSVLELLNIEL
jgi:hypothetical protein